MIVMTFKQGDTISLFNQEDGTAIHIAIGRETAKGVRIAIQAPRIIDIMRDHEYAREPFGENFK